MALRIALSLLPFILHLLFLPQIKAVVVAFLPFSSSYWVVDESNPKEVAIGDTWWTGCHNRTEDGSVCAFFPPLNPPLAEVHSADRER